MSELAPWTVVWGRGSGLQQKLMSFEGSWVATVHFAKLSGLGMYIAHDSPEMTFLAAASNHPWLGTPEIPESEVGGSIRNSCFREAGGLPPRQG